MRYFRSAILPYIRFTLLPSKSVQLLIRSGLKWDQDNCPGMAAALSYYALFSLFPLLLIILSILGTFVAPNTDAAQTIQDLVTRYLPPEVHELIRGTLVSLYENSAGAGIVGTALLLFASSAIFGVLRSSVNRIWRSPARVTEAGSPVKMVLFFVFNKLFSFLLVFGVALLLVVSLIANIVVKIILELVQIFQEKFTAIFPFIKIDELQLSQGLQFSTSVLILLVAACILYKVLPATRVAWDDVWLSALLTTFLLVGLQQLVSNSVITIGSHFLSYGVIGSVMILMLWIFLTFQIFLFGVVLS